MKTILIVTDQPFWRRENGAQQRTWSLLQCLRRNGFQLKVFFLVTMTASDDAICRESELQIVKFNPDGTRLRDRLSTIVRKVLRRLGKSEPPTSDVATSSTFTPATLKTYRWPHAPLQFKSLVASLQPDFVLSVYVVWSNLLDDFPVRQRSFRAFVDTHDLLHVRQQQFCEHDEAHWIAISKEEESAALQKFDLIIATQAVEAETIRSMASQSDVVVVGHHAELPAAPLGFDSSTVSDSATTRMGFIGSNNAANVDGIRWFLQHCWDEIHRTTGAELLIAGTVEKGLSSQRICDQAGVQMLGLIPRIEDFYAQIEFAINPVRFGSGIKIKSIESLCFGKPLVTHSHNTHGLSVAAIDSMIVADDADGFEQGCVRLIHDRDLRSEMTTRVRKVRDSELSEDSVYADLLAWLRR
ncbi:glycosyltransferase [Novipirellula sp. SH528]|uniref:glycosyltransferase n=1 Tax=Novipirellula sp. SH528 TaxID=3454466 RepID=UPI003FA0E89C